MSTAVLAPPPTTSPPSVGAPRPVRWTCDEFHQMGEAGQFEGRRAMLIEGIILEQGPMNPPHAVTVNLVSDTLRAIFGVGWVVRAQLPLELDLSTDPQPDACVVTGKALDYYTSHPTTAHLVVEISDSTLAFDRGEKASLYAAGGIADYWVVDLIHRQLLVFRDPQPDASETHGHVYRQRLTFGPTEAVAPLAAPGSPIAVADLLP